MYKQILLATDGSEHAERAAKHAVHITKISPEATLKIIFVVDYNSVKADNAANWSATDIEDGYRMRVRSIEKIAEEAQVSYETIIILGEPGPKIVDYANRNDMDLLIMGSRGLNALQEFVLGSVSHHVAKRARCPVMIVK